MERLYEAFANFTQAVFSIYLTVKRKSARIPPLSYNVPLFIQSFGFKYGAPVDTNFIFDVRCLPNPYWVPHLQPFSGLDPEIEAFLSDQTEAAALLNDLQTFLTRWLPYFLLDFQQGVIVALGCTGGRHRSVFMAEKLACALKGIQGYQIEVSHRDLAPDGSSVS